MTTTNDDIKQLNSFLRGEISAVETYQQCIDKMDDVSIASQLRRLQASHSNRVTKLQQQIRSLGGTPETDSGVWGSFAKLVEGGAKVFGTSAAIAALEEGEDHGKNDYKADLSELSPEVQQFVRNQLVPEQQKTHDALSQLKHADRV